MALLRHEPRTPETREWPMAILPTWPWLDQLFRDAEAGQVIKVEEFTDEGTLVIRAELPGVDPDKDVEITVGDGSLHLRAERRVEEEKKEKEFRRREIRYGSFERVIPLPDGVDEEAVTAAYTDGILEVRVPLPAAGPKPEARRIAVERSGPAPG